MYIKWLFFSSDLWILYWPVHFRRMWLSGIINITKNKGDSAYPWKILLWIIISVKLFHPAVISTLEFSMVFPINFIISPDILYIFRQPIIQLWGTISYVFCHHYYFTHLRVFLTSVSGWFSTEVWVTASFIKSPGLFLVFYLISIML